MAFSVWEENAEGAGPSSLSGSPVLPAEGIPSVSPTEMNLFRLFPLFCGRPLAIPFSLMYILPQFAGTGNLLFRSLSAAASRNGFSCFLRAQYVFFQPLQGTSLLRLLFPRSGTHVLAFHIPPAGHQGAGRPQRSGNRDAYPLFRPGGARVPARERHSCTPLRKPLLGHHFHHHPAPEHHGFLRSPGRTLPGLRLHVRRLQHGHRRCLHQHPGHAPRNALQKPEHVFPSRRLQLRSALRLPLRCPFRLLLPFSHDQRGRCARVLLAASDYGFQRPAERH